MAERAGLYYVYIIQSQSSKRYYIGVTSDVAQRIRHHNSGANASTKNKGSWFLVYKEIFRDKKLAWKRERQIKKYKGGEAFKKLPPDLRTAIPEYIKDFVPLNQFVA